MDFSPTYLTAVATQIGGVSAFLGGFAATFLGTLLALNVKGRTGTTAIGAAVVSSVAFIIAVVASTSVTATLHPDGPHFGLASIQRTQAMIVLFFMLGLYALLGSLGLSGWARSRATGVTTSVAASLGFILLTILLVSNER